MPFKVAARTILQLGAELISSDGIAFYELIKNAFDAGSPTVEIDVTQRLVNGVYRALRNQLDSVKKQFLEDSDADDAAGSNKTAAELAEALSAFRGTFRASIDVSVPNANDIIQAIPGALSWDALSQLLDSCNTIVIVDKGSGMSAATLDDVYLTIGTRSRLKEREQQKHDGTEDKAERSAGLLPGTMLGEKGLGRLSVMRLGHCVHIETSITGEANINLLDIDWRQFSHSSDALIADIAVAPAVGLRKPDPASRGTEIRISALTSDWSLTRVKEIATHEFGKLIDPFAPDPTRQIVVRFNNQRITIPPLSDLLFEYAHAVVRASYSVDAEPTLVGMVDYRVRNRQKPVSRSFAELVSMGKVSTEVLKSLGPFDVLFYWYNRQLLRKELSSIGEKQQVLDLETEWSGGLKLYRDGFRVNPYGNKDDDWLDLDRKALASGGYKVNRAQIVGRVRITSEGNPSLVDQTNREGLRDCPEKGALVHILKSLLETEFRTFLNQVDDELRAQDPLTFEDLGKRVLSEEQEIRRGLKQLVERHPEIKTETEIVSVVERAAQRIRDLMDSAQELADRVEEGHSQLLHLAGLGLMVEILAHELTRTTQNTLNTVTSAAKSTADKKLNSVFRTLESQLKTLEKRLRVLDPLSVSGRQRKEEFDLLQLVQDVLTAHAAQFARHGIRSEVQVHPKATQSGMRIKAVKGMIVQILENLLSNSVYWLKVQHKIERGFAPSIIIEVDTRAKEIRVSDNGPGIEPRRAEEVFQPFVTSKPPGEGKGLGLYISREIAKYHNATLSLSATAGANKDRLNTFILRLGGESA